MNLIRSALLVEALALAMGATPAAAQASKPNIVFILADDFGYADLKCYGHPYARTPNLDTLATEGTRFTQFYMTGITCCPSRTGLMTGKFPATFREYPAGAGFGKRVTVTGGETMTTDGPFAEAKEHLAGFYLVDCDTEERALAIAAEVPDAVWGLVEVRPVLEQNGADM